VIFKISKTLCQEFRERILEIDTTSVVGDVFLIMGQSLKLYKEYRFAVLVISQRIILNPLPQCELCSWPRSDDKTE